ncbi:AMP-binding protein [Streptomyces sp. NPDC002773]|uniref:AMP-binding protein n=1 Tax=Streptomyces sp. NPDC002773 TaxID=3154430 RepID=UPI0033311EEA
MTPSDATREFLAARNVLLFHRTDLPKAVAEFRWPRPALFNWALDWFDTLADGQDATALRIVGDGGPSTDRQFTFRELTLRSARVANWLRSAGVCRGDTLLLMLGNRAEVWETMLAAIKLGVIVIPTYTTATPAELADRLRRGDVRYVVTEAELTGRFDEATGVTSRTWTGVSAGGGAEGWLPYELSEDADPVFVPDGPTRAEDPLFRYFTSGTTSKPKLVEHTHVSYPIGHLSGMYWNGVRPGDVHLNISAPGWAKHAWSSFFVPWNAEATVVALSTSRTTAGDILDVLRSRDVSTFCAPPTVWRAMVAHGLGRRPAALREATAAGEPLEPRLIEQVERAWGIRPRDGYGQTETTAQIGNPPGSTPVPGSMGFPLPGHRVVLRDPETGVEVPDGSPGEICLDLTDPPAGIMRRYVGDEQRTARVMADGHYHTGDLAVRDRDGSLAYLARADDMFKSFDHRISPRELEEVLLGDAAVADAAVVPVPDPIGLWTPKAYVVTAPDHPETLATARRVLSHARAELPPEKWVRLLEFIPALPRTSSGKIRRAELRARGAGDTEYSVDAPEQP